MQMKSMFKKCLPVVLVVVLFNNFKTYAVPGYGSALYSDLCYSYADVCYMDTSVFNATQIRINKAIYGQTAVIFSQEHFDSCYGDVNTPVFQSFKQYYDPLCVLSFSIAEWGGNSDLRYSFTPAIATRKLANAGVDMDRLNPLQVNSVYYASMGIDVWDTRRYWGPLQVNNSYMTSDAPYKCGYIPMDYYSWPEECQWTFHNKCNLVKSAWNKNYEFKNSYSVIAHMSIAHNSGGNHIIDKNTTLDRNWYPWKSSQAVFDYVDFITSERNVNLILADADAYADKLLEQYRNGSIKGGLYKSIGECRQLSLQMEIDWSRYVKAHWLGNMQPNTTLAGDALSNWEKVMYPVQSIWNYRVLERLYGIRE